MDNIEKRIEEMKDDNDVLVAIVTESPGLFDSTEARWEFSRYQLEILNGKHPSFLRVISGVHVKFFIYGVTTYMKEDREYLEKFMTVCQGDKNVEIIGIKISGDL